MGIGIPEIVVTNRHVIESGTQHRVYATNADSHVDLQCSQRFVNDEARFSPDDDVGYVRLALPCAHGSLEFGDDPVVGDPLWVLGYPHKASLDESIRLSVTSGSMIGHGSENWLVTDAFMDVGSSGGPVVDGTDLKGVAVAKIVDDNGGFEAGFFIPSSIVLNGLLSVNDSSFGYVPRSRASSSRSSAMSSSSFSSSSVSSRTSSASRASSASSRRSSSSVSARQIFPDVPKTRAGYAAIQALYAAGVIGGYPDGTFRPDDGINRAEFAKILVAGFRRSELRGETRCFADVWEEWFASPVCAARRLGWIDGYPDGTFKPAQRINRAEALKILIVAFGLRPPTGGLLPRDVPADAWFEPAVSAAVQAGIVDPRTAFHPGRDLTREDAAIWIDALRR